MPDLLATITTLPVRGPVDPEMVLAATADCSSPVTKALREALALRLQSRDRLVEALSRLEGVTSTL
jgi:hypothetical protein